MRIEATENGPYLVETGGKYRVNGEERTGMKVALCRCGHLGQKPFCDGSHKTVGFKAPAVSIELSQDACASGLARWPAFFVWASVGKVQGWEAGGWDEADLRGPFAVRTRAGRGQRV